jgi:tetratricopeptide (TPR) repeat protein
MDAEAAEKYQIILNSGTDNKNTLSVAYEGMIKFNRSNGNLEAVQELYEDQIALEPSNAWPYGNYADFLLFTLGDYERAIEYASKALEHMNYGAGRFTLAAALCVKWASVVEQNGPDSATIYLDQAYSVYPDLGRVFETTARYRATSFTQSAVEKYLITEPEVSE